MRNHHATRAAAYAAAFTALAFAPFTAQAQTAASPDDVAALRAALAPGAFVILATFAPDGPERCSGLPVQRYDAAMLAHRLGPGFALVAAEGATHTTPWGAEQRFTHTLFRRTLGHSGD